MQPKQEVGDMVNKSEMQEKMAAASSCVPLSIILNKDSGQQTKHV